ncbi:MAG: amino acid ABC transporter permease [Parafilimonas terrae]|nr:amino acid ABC transporter permease [Parafilimonas terrae]
MKLFFTPVLLHWRELVPGFWTTLIIAVSAIILSLIGGLLLALARESQGRPVRWLAVVYMDAFRNTPFVVQLFFFYYGLPELGIRIDALTTGIMALALTTSTNTAEAIRAGIGSIQAGILEAATAFGLSRLQVLRSVVLPLAFRFAIRPLGSIFVNLVLTTSVVSTITVDDLMSGAENLASETYRPFEVYILVLVFYCAITFAVSGLVNIVSILWLRRSSERLAVA